MIPTPGGAIDTHTTFVAGPRRSLSLKLSDTRFYALGDTAGAGRRDGFVIRVRVGGDAVVMPDMADFVVMAQVSDKVPFLADMKPSGKYVMEDVQNIGGTPGLMKYQRPCRRPSFP